VFLQEILEKENECNFLIDTLYNGVEEVQSIKLGVFTGSRSKHMGGKTFTLSNTYFYWYFGNFNFQKAFPKN
jgi:hypothetical protein